MRDTAWKADARTTAFTLPYRPQVGEWLNVAGTKYVVEAIEHSNQTANDDVLLLHVRSLKRKAQDERDLAEVERQLEESARAQERRRDGRPGWYEAPAPPEPP